MVCVDFFDELGVVGVVYVCCEGNFFDANSTRYFLARGSDYLIRLRYEVLTSVSINMFKTRPRKKGQRKGGQRDKRGDTRAIVPSTLYPAKINPFFASAAHFSNNTLLPPFCNIPGVASITQLPTSSNASTCFRNRTYLNSNGFCASRMRSFIMFVKRW